MNSPSSSSLALIYHDKKCEICQKSSHGVHFGVESCRACAAFFRRAVVLNCKYKCKGRDGKCETISSIGQNRVICRYCRLKKCKNLGMTTENVRYDETLPADIDETKIETLAIAPIIPTFEAPKIQTWYRVTDPDTGKQSAIIDVSAILTRSRMMLEKYYLPEDEEMEKLNALQRMTFALEKMRKKQQPVEDLEFLAEVSFFDIFATWQDQMVDAAEFLMFAKEFRGLPPHERLAFFKIVWSVYRRFERFCMSAQMFGRRSYDEKIFLHSHDKASFLNKLKVDYTQVYRRVHRGMTYDFFLSHFEIVVLPFLEYNFTTTEVAYMLCQIVWNYAGRRLQGQTLAAGERFCEEIGNNLHEYYKTRDCAGQYSGRVMKMMGVVNNMLNTQLERENMMDVVVLFNLLDIIITEPDFFKV